MFICEIGPLTDIWTLFNYNWYFNKSDGFDITLVQDWLMKYVYHYCYDGHNIFSEIALCLL